MTVARRLARMRVPLGFVFAAAVLYLARPTFRSIAIGAAVGFCGQAIRLWAAGHLEKARIYQRGRWTRAAKLDRRRARVETDSPSVAAIGHDDSIFTSDGDVLPGRHPTNPDQIVADRQTGALDEEGDDGRGRCHARFRDFPAGFWSEARSVDEYRSTRSILDAQPPRARVCDGPPLSRNAIDRQIFPRLVEQELPRLPGARRRDDPVGRGRFSWAFRHSGSA